jgi:hypothetical protein
MGDAVRARWRDRMGTNGKIEKALLSMLGCPISPSPSLPRPSSFRPSFPHDSFGSWLLAVGCRLRGQGPSEEAFFTWPLSLSNIMLTLSAKNAGQNWWVIWKTGA